MAANYHPGGIFFLFLSKVTWCYNLKRFPGASNVVENSLLLLILNSGFLTEQIMYNIKKR